MKLLVITAIQEFEKDIKFMLKKSDIKLFSYSEITGYHDFKESSMEENWFPGDRKETSSIIFYAFVKKEKSDELFNNVKEFNDKQKTLSKVHVAVLNIEKSN